jgi:hypothetical protein
LGVAGAGAAKFLPLFGLGGLDEVNDFFGEEGGFGVVVGGVAWVVAAEIEKFALDGVFKVFFFVNGDRGWENDL